MKRWAHARAHTIIPTIAVFCLEIKAAQKLLKTLLKHETCGASSACGRTREQYAYRGTGRWCIYDADARVKLRGSIDENSQEPSSNDPDVSMRQHNKNAPQKRGVAFKQRRRTSPNSSYRLVRNSVIGSARCEPGGNWCRTDRRGGCPPRRRILRRTCVYRFRIPSSIRCISA